MNESQVCALEEMGEGRKFLPVDVSDLDRLPGREWAGTEGGQKPPSHS